MTIDEMQERMLNILAGYYRNNHVFHASPKNAKVSKSVYKYQVL